MTGLVIRALKRRLGQDARPEGRTGLLRPSGRVKWPSRPFRARITDTRTFI
jgi:hypothetical protein